MSFFVCAKHRCLIKINGAKFADTLTIMNCLTNQRWIVIIADRRMDSFAKNAFFVVVVVHNHLPCLTYNLIRLNPAKQLYSESMDENNHLTDQTASRRSWTGYTIGYWIRKNFSLFLTATVSKRNRFFFISFRIQSEFFDKLEQTWTVIG